MDFREVVVSRSRAPWQMQTLPKQKWGRGTARLRAAHGAQVATVRPSEVTKGAEEVEASSLCLKS